MTPVQFKKILGLVQLYIQKLDTNFRNCIPPAERLELTLRYLATDETQTSLQLPFRIQQSTISKILKETIYVLYDVLNEEQLKFPKDTSDWIAIANDVYHLWGFPNCLRALDGKLCKIKTMKNFGSNYFCYKGTNSFVLMAIADVTYKFIIVDVGINGRIVPNLVPLSMPSNLPAPQTPSPYVFVADDAFPLSHYIMKPYSHKNLTTNQIRFNYISSRNRLVVENAFEIRANCFQVLFSPSSREPNEAINVALSCICLHNYLREDNFKYSVNSEVMPPEEVDGINNRHFDSLNNRIVGAPKKKAATIRKPTFYPEISI